uniref:alanine transaminase n=1 Tax=Periophthalmus magnuspinnatus TaxID=409849 RepID=A0A3B4APS7_9GOBI
AQRLSCLSISCLRCGLRAGFMELVNIDPRVMHFVDTMLCTDISTPVMGQLALDLMVKPPKPGDASYHTYTEVLAVCVFPDLLRDDSIPLDARQRAQRFLDICPQGIHIMSAGVYSSTTGMPYVVQRIAEFISKRDGGIAADPNQIFFYSGTQENLKMVLNLLSSGSGEMQTGVLTPLPYPHTLPRLLQYTRLKLVPCSLKQSQGWAVNTEELHRTVTEAREHCNPRALFICNPGIPTGHIQDRKSMESVIRFAAAERLILLVQEVYQDCVHGPGIEFLSYKKVLLEMSQEYSEHVELISFNSLSNGSLGECGLRGGYMELVNTDTAVAERLKVLMGFRSPPVLPQPALEVMINPPTPGEPSYPTYKQVKTCSGLWNVTSTMLLSHNNAFNLKFPYMSKILALALTTPIITHPSP